MNHRQLAAVVFDLDGLMFNTEELYDEVGDILLRRRGFRFTPHLKDKMMGRQAKIALQIMIDEHELDATVDDLQAETAAAFAEILPDRLSPLPGCVELLDALEAARIPKAIATSSGRAFTEKVLAAFDLQPRFEFLLTAEDVHQGKPHPEIYLTAAKRLRLPPPRMMVLEDSQNGCRAAVAVGAFVVAVPSPHSHHHDFRGAALVAENLADRAIYEALEIAR